MRKNYFYNWDNLEDNAVSEMRMDFGCEEYSSQRAMTHCCVCGGLFLAKNRHSHIHDADAMCPECFTVVRCYSRDSITCRQERTAWELAQDGKPVPEWLLVVH